MRDSRSIDLLIKDCGELSEILWPSLPTKPIDTHDCYDRVQSIMSNLHDLRRDLLGLAGSEPV